MYCTSLDHHIALAHRFLRTVVEGQFDLAFENDTKVHALGTVLCVQFVLIGIFDGEKVADSAINPRGVDQRNHLAVVINERSVDLGRDSQSSANICDARVTALRRLSCGRVQRDQDVVGQKDSFAIGRVSCATTSD